MLHTMLATMILALFTVVARPATFASTGAPSPQPELAGLPRDPASPLAGMVGHMSLAPRSATDHLYEGAGTASGSDDPLSAIDAHLAEIRTRPAAMVDLTPGWDLAVPAVIGDPGLAPRAVRRIVRENYGRLAQCLEPAVPGDRVTAEHVTVQFVIGGDGKVAAVRMRSRELRDESALTCAAGVFYSLQFARPRDGSLVVVYPLQMHQS